MSQAIVDAIILGRSAAIESVRDRILKVADDRATVIVTGPSGSGKECVAHALHAASSRRDAPFVAVNCGAISKELLESELFGHERGSFTGAHTARIGRFEQAKGGTLFLDEIGDMPVDMQVKLLRVLEQRTFERVGGNRHIATDVRIISATHRNLEAAIAGGQFREDLYYRLAVVPIEMPSLSARKSDVPVLLDHFAKAAKCALTGILFSEGAWEEIHAHDWPGNVRELRNFIERAAILHAGETIHKADVKSLLRRAIQSPEPARRQSEGPLSAIDTQFDLATEMARIERGYIKGALEKHHANVAAAARSLGLHRTTLIEKMRRYRLGRNDAHASAIGSTAAIAI